MQPPHVNASINNEYFNLCLSRPLAIAADDLHLVRCDLGLIVQLERHILDQERPDFVAESVGIEVALERKREEQKSQPHSNMPRRPGSPHPVSS